VQARVRTLRIVFGVVVLALAIEIIVNGITGKV
jgi:small neutral amino acid transporter SnatA (MarC family)